MVEYWSIRKMKEGCFKVIYIKKIMKWKGKRKMIECYIKGKQRSKFLKLVKSENVRVKERREKGFFVSKVKSFCQQQIKKVREKYFKQ